MNRPEKERENENKKKKKEEVITERQITSNERRSLSGRSA